MNTPNEVSYEATNPDNSGFLFQWDIAEL